MESQNHGGDRRRVFRAIELMAVMALVPLISASGTWSKRYVMILLLAAVAAAVGIVRKHRPAPAELGLGPSRRAGFFTCLADGTTIFGAIFASVAIVHAYLGKPMTPMAMNRPLLMLLIALVYPLSVIAQEFVFRSFFFWRYRDLLGPIPLAILNAACFGWVHMFYGSWFSVLISAAGGLIFEWLYLRHRSMWGVVVVHSMFGVAVFATGYGQYFYHGRE